MGRLGFLLAGIIVDDEFLVELAQALLQVAEESRATSDVLVLICLHYAQTAPDQVSGMIQLLKALRESEIAQPSPSFVALAQRVEGALSGDFDIRLPSLQERSCPEGDPAALRALLRVIQGGRS